MIEINLRSGSGKKARVGRGPSLNLGGAFSGVLANIKDPFLLGGVAAAAASVLAVFALWTTQAAQASALTEREQRAVQDSTKFAAVLKERQGAEAQRDSALRQLNIIRSIDNNRFIWAHVMDELSRALPAYTWLTSVVQTSAPPSVQLASSDSSAKGDKAADKKKAAGKGKKGKGAELADTTAGRAEMKFHMVGNTVDIQALTRFMKDLEASPFVQNVQLVKTNIVVQDGKEVTEFQLDAEYQTPAPEAIRTVPVSLSVR